MRGIKQVRILLLVVVGVLLLMDIGAAVVLISPATRSQSEGERERTRLQAELLSKREPFPVRDMDARITKTRDELKDFYKSRLPQGYASISDGLGKIAAQNHVQVTAVKYQNKSVGVGKLDRLDVVVSVTGTYQAQMNFMNALERDKTFFILDQLNFAGTQQNSNQLKVDFHLETYLLRNEA